MATTTATKMTADEFYEWANRPENDDRRFELDNGEVVEMPSPSELHGLVCWLTSVIIGNYLFRRGSGYACSNDSGLLVRRNPDTVRGPDLMVFLESRTADEVSKKFSERVPALVVEVYSPSDRPGEYNRRIAQYHARGIPLVWVIYPEERAVSVCRPNEFPKFLDESDELTGNGVLPDFACRVRDLFTSPGASPPAS